MIGVRPQRRGRGMLRTRAIHVLVAALAALAGPLAPTGLRAADAPQGFRPANVPRITRDIRQTAKPGDDLDEAGSSSIRKTAGRDSVVAELEDLKEPLAAVMIEGNKTIPTDEIAKKLKTRAGRVPDARQIKDDIRELHKTRWFFNVEIKVTRSKDGPVLVFKVLERPILQKVEYKGNKKIKTKELAGLTGLKPGGAYDVGSNKESARRIESTYQDKGFIHAKVELEKGSSPDEREVIFKITEGPKVHVDKISFTGNKEISGPVLKTQVKTKTRLLWLFGGKYDPASVPEDIAALKQYYHGLGYFD